MDAELPYEMEWPLLHRMITRTVALIEAAKVLGVTPPTAKTSLQHLESIGLVWQLPLEGRSDRSIHSQDWEITPAGRAMVGGLTALDGGADLPRESPRVISDFLTWMWAA